ncbi:MAG: class I SAM-dependent methyltransferase [Nanoarchaeota archaeon]|nr:class I SAM-dependent methyltransferase [Nanoarchaeota archaeon]MBU0962454.1 class I SAM-dependent methyltransferase [Nanoarchaeota archaeon]
MRNLYDYPKYYNLLFGNRNFKKECKFIQKLFEKYSKIKVSSILDIACGNGMHIIEFTKLGYKIAGLDISEKMLNETNKRLENNPNLIKLYHKDMVSFYLDKKFDACICMVNSLEILNKDTEFISNFNSVADALNEGGLYIIELDNPNLIKNNDQIKEYKKIIKKGKITINLIYKKYPFDYKTKLEKNELILNVDEDGKRLKIVDNSPIRRLTIEDINYFVNKTKRFEIMDVINDFNLNLNVKDKSPNKIIVVLKKIS